MKRLKKGDLVLWSGNNRKEAYKEVTVISIEQLLLNDSRLGKAVEEINWAEVNNCIVEIERKEWSGSKWAGGYQLKPIGEML